MTCPTPTACACFPSRRRPARSASGSDSRTSPLDGDQVTEHDGLRVFVAPELAEPLDDAEIDVAAEDGTSRIVFRPQRQLVS